MAGGVNGIALGCVAAGGLFLFAAVKGKTVLGTVQALIKGASPSSAPAAAPIATASTGNATVTGLGGYSGPQQALQQAARAYGWDAGTEWQALQSLEMAEAGFNPAAVNPTSGALGIAQALGHGGSATAGTLGNEYGGFGLSTAQAQAANSGDAGAQSVWMVNYIAATYGTPAAAWAHEQSAGWY